jgi:hypothetical protein
MHVSIESSSSYSTILHVGEAIRSINNKQNKFEVQWTLFTGLCQSLLVYRLGYGPFKAEGGVRFPGGEDFLHGVMIVDRIMHS